MCPKLLQKKVFSKLRDLFNFIRINVNLLARKRSALCTHTHLDNFNRQASAEKQSSFLFYAAFIFNLLANYIQTPSHTLTHTPIHPYTHWHRARHCNTYKLGSSP